MNFYIFLAISVFAACCNASGCPIEITAKEPKYGTTGKFGEVHLLTFSKTSGKTSCLWKFSNAKNYLLNLLFINTTAQSPPSGSGCSGNHALIKTYDADSRSSTTLDRYCGDRRLSGIRINGTIEIELHDSGSVFGDRGISLAVFVESSSKHCGGIFNDSSYGVPVSYDSSLVPRNEITHCVWFFEFHQARTLSVIASYFDLVQDFVVGRAQCSNKKQYLSMRSWNQINWDSYQEIRECKAHSQQTPIFNLPTNDNFAVTVHSENWFLSKRLYAVCFPSTEGFSNSYLTINGKGNQTYQDVSLNDTRLVEALLVLKPKESKDQLFFVLKHGKQICIEGTAEIWSEQANIFHRNSSLCSSPNGDLHSVFNFQDTALLYFKMTVSQLKEIQIWFYSSNKGCGGLFQFLPGHSIVIKSPTDSNGEYPAESNCRWVYLADRRMRTDIAVKEMTLEKCSGQSCTCDYVDIYQGFRKQQNKLYRICSLRSKSYSVMGDVEIYFESDASTQFSGFKINVTEVVCGGTLALSSGQSREITSPSSGNGKYPAKMDCQWNFPVSNFTGLVIDVIKMDLEHHESCDYDYVGIYTGVYPVEVMQYKLCSKPKTYLLLNGNTTFKFRSDSFTEKTGFKVAIFAVVGTKYRSCSEALLANRNMKSRYLLQIDSETVVVYCERRENDVITMITHQDSDKQFHVSGFEDRGSYKKTLNYMQNISGIAKVIDRSDKCFQAVNVTCFASIIKRIPSLTEDDSWLTNRANHEMSYWAGGPANGTGCACGTTTSCASTTVQCNCDINDNVLRFDYGLVTEKSDLPLTSLRTGDTGRNSEYKDITIGNVVCFNAIPTVTTTTTIATKQKSTTAISTKTSSISKISTTVASKTKDKSGKPVQSTVTTKAKTDETGVAGKKGMSTSSNATMYAIGSALGVVAVIFIVVVIVIIKRRRINSLAKNTSAPTGPKNERTRQNSTMPLVEMTDMQKSYVPDASVLYSVPDASPGEAKAIEWNNPYYESGNNTTSAIMEAENPYYGCNTEMVIENPYYQSSDEVQHEAEYETADFDGHVYAAPDANPSKAVYSYATTEELTKSGQNENGGENFYEYADTEQGL